MENKRVRRITFSLSVLIHFFFLSALFWIQGNRHSAERAKEFLAIELQAPQHSPSLKPSRPTNEKNLLAKQTEPLPPQKTMPRPSSDANKNEMFSENSPALRALIEGNPKPPYPRDSRRLGEQGRVLLRVELPAGATLASKVFVAQSSGFERLDKIAAATIQTRWTFNKNESDQTRSIDVPIEFKLNKQTSL